jgi:GH15 family glucan-1,4-alpha-glucosidase
VLDASLLMMPLVGFVVPQDPMWLATLEAMDAELVADSLVYRYDPTASPDGLRGQEGTWACTARRSARPASSWATSPRPSPTCP